MLNLKKFLAVAACLALSAGLLSSCSDKDKSESDGFSISQIDNPVSSTSQVNNELVETVGTIGTESDYFGIKLTVNEIYEKKYTQYSDGKVFIIELTLKNDSENPYVVKAMSNFELTVDGKGAIFDFMNAQIMTIAARGFNDEGNPKNLFGSDNTPAIQPGETYTGFFPIRVEEPEANFANLCLRFFPDIDFGNKSCITYNISPADIKPAS